MKASFHIQLSFFLCDPVGIQTQDLQNRNLTLYSAKLRDQIFILTAKVRISEQNAKDFELFLFPHMVLEEVEEKEDGCIAHGNPFRITDDAVVAVSNGTIRVNLP